MFAGRLALAATATSSGCRRRGPAAGERGSQSARRPLVRAVLSPRDDYTLPKHAAFKGFEILSRGQPAAPVPDLFIRGAGTYSAHINAGNPIGTKQSIEHTLRALDRAVDEQHQLQRLEKTSPTIGPRPSGPSSMRRG